MATLAAQTCSTLADLRSLCQILPGRLHALNNEVADLELVLFQLASLVKEREYLPESKETSIPHLLNRARIKLVDLEDIVSGLNITYRNAKIPLSGAKGWRKERTKL